MLLAIRIVHLDLNRDAETEAFWPSSHVLPFTYAATMPERPRKRREASGEIRALNLWGHT